MLHDNALYKLNLMLTLTLTLTKTMDVGDQDLSYTIHLPSLVMICPVVFVLSC